jgi:hypothetical protein
LIATLRIDLLFRRLVQLFDLQRFGHRARRFGAVQPAGEAELAPGQAETYVTQRNSLSSN